MSFNVLKILCDFHHTQDDMEGEEVGKTLLRQLAERYDKPGHFVREYFDREHFTVHSANDTFSYIPSNSWTYNTGCASFKEIVQRLRLAEPIKFNYVNAYSMFTSSFPMRDLEPVVYFYFLVHSVLLTMTEYYRSLLSCSQRDRVGAIAISEKLRKFSAKLQQKKEHFPFLSIMKKALRNEDLTDYIQEFSAH